MCILKTMPDGTPGQGTGHTGALSFCMWARATLSVLQRGHKKNIVLRLLFQVFLSNFLPWGLLIYFLTYFFKVM